MNENRQRKYITTAISYTNGEPHIGHLYEFILADVINRYHQIFNYDTYFLTGTDEHGQKIANTAADKNMIPIDLCNMYSDIFKDMDNKMHILYDQFIRTSNIHHHDKVNEVFRLCSEKGDIYLGEYVGWYNIREETFISEMDAKLCNYIDIASGKPLVQIKEPSHFFRLSKYHNKVIEYLERADVIYPISKKTEILERLKKEPLKDLSITRKNITWGIPVKKLKESDDDGFVFYVWFDALSNYISALDMPNSSNNNSNDLSLYWNESNIAHVIGKDILWFHSVIWIAMLLSLEIKLPENIIVHNFVCDEHGNKMSKSLGNVINPFDLIGKYPVSAIRYYCMKTGYESDLKFSEKNLIDSHNSELLNKYGNLYNRMILQLLKATNGLISTTGPSKPLFDTNFYINKSKKYLQKYQIAKLAYNAMRLVEILNQSINENRPWKMILEDRSLYLKSLAEGINYVTMLLYPIIPDETSIVLHNFGYNQFNFNNLNMDWNNLNGIQLSAQNILFNFIKSI